MENKISLDTSILIGLFNKREFFENILSILNQNTEMFVSAVVLNELIRGCHDTYSMEVLQGMLQLFSSNIITPTQKHWIECARISEQLLKQKKRNKQDILLLQNDILIALCARDFKTTLITSDKKDFSFLSKHFHFDVEYWTQ